LDSVSLILDVEREFGIEIPDAEAAELGAVGALHACILRHLGASDRVQASADAWDRLVRIFTEGYGVTPERVRADARIAAELGID
jgi:hypothetical protein